jgi:methionyl-tRNA synthetase
MAKDNVPFHTITFPCTLIGSGEPWKLADYIKGFNWLNFYGEKFSTSQRRGIFLDRALEEYPSDYWRYFLVARAPESDDSDFRFDVFAGVVNKDLADTLGNFVNRSLTFSATKFGDEVPEGGRFTDRERALCDELSTKVAEYTGCLDALEYRKAAASLKSIWSVGNKYFADSEPWAAYKSDKGRAACILRTSINLVRLFAVLSHPIIPGASRKLLEALRLDPNNVSWPTTNIADELSRLRPGKEFNVPEPLFKKIEDDEVKRLEEVYGGQSHKKLGIETERVHPG